jgi:nitroreductase
MNRTVVDGLPPERLNDRSDALSLLATRRSASVKAMTDPGPTAEQLATLLDIAVRVPDHGKLTPWRFILFEGPARERFGELLAARWRELHPDHGEATVAQARNFFLRAPAVLAVVSRAAPHVKIPEWEQVLSAGAVCLNILVAATAMGLGCQWNTDWCAYDEKMLAAMGLLSHEKIAGFIYLGTPSEAITDRPRPTPESLLTRWREAP